MSVSLRRVRNLPRMGAIETSLQDRLETGHPQSHLPPEDWADLASLLESFQVTSLGDGNPVAGSNMLAAMAIGLANLARPGSCLVAPDGRRMEVGCHLLATGPLVSGAVLEEVVRPVNDCQNNLLGQLARLVKDEKAEANRLPQRRWSISDGPQASGGEAALFELMVGDNGLSPLYGTLGGRWVDVVSDAPADRFDDLVQRPRAFIAAPTPRSLEQQVSQAHCGHPLVAISLNRAADAAKFGDLCPALMDGLLPAGPSEATVSGKLLVTDIGGVLREVAAAEEDSSAWVGRLLWLVEGRAGPDLPILPAGDVGVVRLPNPTGQFERAVRRAFADRLNSREPLPSAFKCEFAKMQTRWLTFLTSMESSLPGINATARKLVATLSFGLRRLAGADTLPKGFYYTMEGIEAFARLLVQRMANHRAAMLFSTKSAHRLKSKRRILDKLW